MRKMAAMEDMGEMPSGTFDKWMEKTKNPKQLPKRKSGSRSKRGRKKR